MGGRTGIKTQVQAVEGLLRGESEFLHYKVITEKILKKHSFFGPNPQNTVLKILSNLREKGVVEWRERGSGYYRLIEERGGKQPGLF